MRLKNMRSLRELSRLLDCDNRLRDLCLVKPGQRSYGRSVLSRFINKVGPETLNRIIDQKVTKLLKQSKQTKSDVILDASFIKAFSTRNPNNNQIGLSDPDTRVGRNGKTYNLGYKLHLAVDSKTFLPLAEVVVSANQNEKRHSINLVDKAKRILAKAGVTFQRVIADSQYSDQKLRVQAPKAVVPYPACHRRGVLGLLRVDKKFRTYGPKSQIKQYHKRPHIEAVYSLVKLQCSLVNNKVRGTENVACYAFISLFCLVLIREAAQNISRKDKAKSPTYFNN
jgi:hypothetical protein